MAMLLSENYFGARDLSPMYEQQQSLIGDRIRAPKLGFQDK